MKTFLVVLLMVHFAITEHSDPPTEREHCLQKVNAARAEYARTHQIANMNKLKYNDELEKTLLPWIANSTGCTKPTIDRHFAESIDVFSNVEENGNLEVHLLAGPDRSTMACMKTHCVENGKDVINIAVDTSVLSPKKGTPGSKCGRYRKTNSDGLCTIRRGFNRKIFGGIVNTMKNVAEGVGKIVTKAAKGCIKLIERKADEVGDNIKEKIKNYPHELAKKYGPKVTLRGSQMIGSSVGSMIGTAICPGVGTFVGGVAGYVIGDMIGVEIQAELETQTKPQ